MTLDVKTIKRINRVWIATAVILSSIAFTYKSNAQTWQYVYGSPTNVEMGESGVTPVTGACSSPPACATCLPNGDGYIAVGTRLDLGGSDNDVYVVRTDNNGAMIWEKTYDILGTNSTDEAESIIELSDGSGFVIVGITETVNPTAAFLMKIDCDGNLVWTQVYSGQFGVFGTDVIEATTGDQLRGTSPGDLVVSGFIGINQNDALIFRTTAAGALIWDASYRFGFNIEEVLHDLIEATPIAGQTTGDIVSVGFAHLPQTATADVEGLVVRVNGDDGSILAGVQGTGLYGIGEYQDVFFAVTELQNPVERGSLGYQNIVITGVATDIPAGSAEIYMVKLGNGNPWTPLAQTTIGTTETQVGYDVKEITVPISSGGGPNDLAQWDLVVTGEVSNGAAPRDAYLLGVNAANLAPLPNIGRRYHPTGTDVGEWGRSLAIVDDVGGRTEGVIMCGSTTSDWLRIGDPGDMYLLKTDIALSTNRDCEEDYHPPYTDRDRYLQVGLTVETRTIDDNPEFSVDTDRDWGDEVCTNSGNSGKRVIGSGNENPDLSYTIQSLKNPLQSGEQLTFRLKGADVPATLAVQIVNPLGKTIMNESSVSPESDGTVSFNTSGWNAGVYFAAIDDGSYSRMIRFIIVE